MSMQLATKDVILIIAKALGELNEKAVFVGGSTVPFYLPEIYLSQARPTEDIDVAMEIVGRNENWINEEKLRQKGFHHDTSEGAPICRWLYRDFKVDIMSSDISAFGFTNQWYKEGIDSAIEVVSSPTKVKIFNLPCFIASKIEAFHSRGQSDYVGSSDMEDIISVLEVASEEMFEKILPQVSDKLKSYLKKEFQNLLNTSNFTDALPGAVFNRANSLAAAEVVKNRMKNI